MKFSNPPSRPGVTRRWALLALAAGGAAPLAGCGGGGVDVAGLSSGGTGSFSGGGGSFTGGTVGGLGSIIVNGIRFDDTQAVIERIDGEPLTALQVGMVVVIEAGEVAQATDSGGLPAATASAIRFGSEWLGPVDAVGDGEITLLGQTVEVSAATVFDGGGVVRRWTELTSAHVIEVYGYLDAATSRLRATRIELRRDASYYKVSGAVSSVDAPGRSFGLGRAAIRPGRGMGMPPGLAPGQLVAVRLSTAGRSGNVVTATRVVPRQAASAGAPVPDGNVANLLGAVTAVRSAIDFDLEGVPVLAPGVAQLPLVKVGALLSVRGRMAGGRVRATEVTPADPLPQASGSYLFFGSVGDLVADTGGSSFRLRGLDFVTDAATVIRVPGWVSGATPDVKVTAVQVDGQWTAVSITRP